MKHPALLIACAVTALGAASLPVLSGQRVTRQDTAAQRDARAAVTALEACHVRTRNYGACGTPAALNRAGVRIGRGPGQISVTAALNDDFVLTARSYSGNVFKVTRTDGGAAVRSCSFARHGGCATGGRW